jgi:N-acetyltransferase
LLTGNYVHNPGRNVTLEESSAIGRVQHVLQIVPIRQRAQAQRRNRQSFCWAQWDYAGLNAPTPETLREIHRAHLFTVPFENLDIHLGRKIVCDEDSFLHKIVNERRGGFCYELNGAFAAFLRALGFQVTLLSARVARSDGSDSPEFDHLTLRVDLDESWLVDVGSIGCNAHPNAQRCPPRASFIGRKRVASEAVRTVWSDLARYRYKHWPAFPALTQVTM